MSTSATRPRALITGASRGIGRAVALDLGRDHHVLVGGRDQAATEAVCAELPSAEPFLVDLSDAEATADAVASIDRVDVLVHSSGVADFIAVADADRARWRRILEINVIAVADLTRLLLPALRTARGQVIMINSGSGYLAHPNGALYSASKFAQRALADALREEERGVVRVSSIHPGRVDTEMQARIQQDRGNTAYRGDEYLTAASVAAAVRVAVDATDEAMIETLSIRPVNRG